MISGKSQIVRQRKIDSDKIVEQVINDEFSLDVSEELEQINQSIAKMTLKLNTEPDKYTEFDFSNNNYQYDLEPSSSSSASSPSTLLTEKSPKVSSSSNFDTEPSTENFFSKSDALNSQSAKTIMSNNSIPLKSNRLANLMKLGQANSFFSRSCPGEEICDGLPEAKLSQKNENHNRIRNFLTFSSRLKSRKNDTSPNSSSRASVNSVFSECSSSGMNDKAHEKKTKIGSYEVDLEKLARELVLPSAEAPLTSFKSQFQSSKTLNTKTSNKSNKQLQRSMTQNK